jgi:hypothetical protein
MTTVWSIEIEHQEMLKWWKNRQLGIKHEFHGMDCQCFPCCESMKKAQEDGLFYSTAQDIPMLKFADSPRYIAYCPWCGKDTL